LFQHKRLGRGPGSGTGKLAGKGHGAGGHRGKKAAPNGFEGGQTTIIKRSRKIGFNNQ
jgi:large subunit ribosomal protein L15